MYCRYCTLEQTLWNKLYCTGVHHGSYLTAYVILTNNILNSCRFLKIGSSSYNFLFGTDLFQKKVSPHLGVKALQQIQ